MAVEVLLLEDCSWDRVGVVMEEFVVVRMFVLRFRDELGLIVIIYEEIIPTAMMLCLNRDGRYHCRSVILALLS